MKPYVPTILSLVLTAGCVPQDVSPIPTPPADGGCYAERAAHFLGQQYSPAVAEQARVQAGAEVVRHIVPGQIITLEHLSTRLTLEVNAANVITRAYCG